MPDKQDIGEVFLEDVRLSFAQHLYEAGTFIDENGNESKPTFSCNFLLDRASPTYEKNKKKIMQAAAAVKEAKWGPKDQQPKLKPEKKCWKDGDLESYDGYEGCDYIVANSQSKPPVVNRSRKEVLPGEPQAPYSGCDVNGLVRLYCSEHVRGGKRLSASLEGVQFLRDGEAFGHKAIDPNEKFKDLSHMEEDDDVKPIGGGDDDDDGVM